MYSKRSELEIRVRMAVLCTRIRVLSLVTLIWFLKRYLFRYPYQRSEFEIRVEIRVASCTFL